MNYAPPSYPNQELERCYPKLKPGEYQIISPANPFTNCLGFVLGYRFQPARIARPIEAVFEFFKNRGWERCQSSELEPRYEKLGIYIGLNGLRSHFVIQDENGKWLSKLGDEGEVIRCDRAEALEGRSYGLCRYFMKRLRTKS